MTEVTLSPEQLEIIVGAIIGVGMCICACLGLSAHRTSD